jgi:hypothetical protein
MNYDIMAELLAEGFKREQLLEEDWEALKKELADLYVAGKITERQISTRLNKAGMGSLSKNAAYKIAHDPDNAQKREVALQRVKDAEEEKAKRAALAAQAAKHQTRGSAAQAYCDAWNKKFGHIVKAGVVREALENALENQGVIFEDSIVDDYFVNLFEEVNSIGETKMTEEKLTKIFEETLEEAFSADKLKKHLKRGAIALGATAALAAAPGVVGGVKNVKREAAQSEMDKAGKEYNYSRAEDRTNEFAQELHKKGIEFKDTATKYGKEYGSKAKAYGAEKAADGKAFAGAYKELKFAAKSLDAAINADVKAGPDIVANFNAECNHIKEKYGEEAYNQAKKALETEGKLSNLVRSAINKAKIKKLVKEDVNYFPY